MGKRRTTRLGRDQISLGGETAALSAGRRAENRARAARPLVPRRRHRCCAQRRRSAGDGGRFSRSTILPPPRHRPRRPTWRGAPPRWTGCPSARGHDCPYFADGRLSWPGGEHRVEPRKYGGAGVAARHVAVARLDRAATVAARRSRLVDDRLRCASTGRPLARTAGWWPGSPPRRATRQPSVGHPHWLGSPAPFGCTCPSLAASIRASTSTASMRAAASTSQRRHRGRSPLPDVGPQSRGRSGRSADRGRTRR